MSEISDARTEVLEWVEKLVDVVEAPTSAVEVDRVATILRQDKVAPFVAALWAEGRQEADAA